MPTTPHPMDVLFQRMTPTVMVPLRGEFEPMTEPGQRFLVARDGLWMELNTPWLYLLYPLAQQNAVTIPCGSLEPSISFHYGAPPVDLLQDFHQEAKDSARQPIAAWISWNTLSGFRYHALQRDPAAARGAFKEAALGDGESLAFVLTSRGAGSVTGGEGDWPAHQSGVYMAGVYGHCDRPDQEYRYTLHAQGLRLEMGDVFSMLAH